MRVGFWKESKAEKVSVTAQVDSVYFKMDERRKISSLQDKATHTYAHAHAHKHMPVFFTCYTWDDTLTYSNHKHGLNLNLIQGTVKHIVNYVYSLSHQVLDKNIDITWVSVMLIWNYGYSR